MYIPAGSFTAAQAAMLAAAQRLFIFEQLIIFPLYYLPGLRGLAGGDGQAAKFPCSISWMTRRGLPRHCTLCFWNLGWVCLMRALLKDGDVAAMSFADWLRAGFMMQMYAAGFTTVVLTPMKGPDVAMGASDALHCYAAMLYVFDHFIANQFVLGVSAAYSVAFVAASLLCGVFQALRADGERLGRALHGHLGGGQRVRLKPFLYALDLGFMVTENALFFIFLFGMTSGVSVVET